MTTINDIIRYNIARASSEIAGLKARHPNGISPKMPDGWQGYQAAKRRASLWLTALKVLKAANKHGMGIKTKADFHKILRLDAEELAKKRRLALGVISIIKTEEKLRAVMGARQSIHCHAPRGKERQLALKAFGALRKAANRLEKDPSRFEAAGKWAAERAREIAASKAPKEAVMA